MSTSNKVLFVKQTTFLNCICHEDSMDEFITLYYTCKLSTQKFGSTFLCTLWRGGEGGKKKRTICTLPKMSVIMNDPLNESTN